MMPIVRLRPPPQLPPAVPPDTVPPDAAPPDAAPPSAACPAHGPSEAARHATSPAVLVPTHALSIRQPWAGLIVAGVKTVEIRTWATRRRGPFFIHASKTVDPRPEGWQWVRPELRTLCEQRGGLIGVANLINCLRYTTPEAFAADVPRHCNAAAWFHQPGLFGFQLADARAWPFTAYSGTTGFFPVPLLIAPAGSTS